MMKMKRFVVFAWSVQKKEKFLGGGWGDALQDEEHHIRSFDTLEEAEEVLEHEKGQGDKNRFQIADTHEGKIVKKSRTYRGKGGENV